MLVDYSYIALFLVAAILFTAVVLGLPVLLKKLGIVPSKPNPVKNSAYECGVETHGRTWVQFNFRYYYYALLLIAFDVLLVFLFPWATQIGSLGFYAFGIVFAFLLIVLAGYLYAWKKGALEWN
ncbi:MULTISPECIES: NADH-quinone oxidoreductase subunit A [Dehalococcoides]|jgi:NADH-quinone oxidoreductase subunit A|uniref:NADH-quinone oxidoreductase subunit A n=2 Tax=Dehalococcoides mccartyi TaxID=61435 RepID=A0A142VA02_9CHLR|nr:MULTISPECIES: NADH-quinone oxidoreductase subunit A [Dehalococcoides]AGG06468.1 NADH ubiquinone oxidoreductase chain A [Dehalococcoides mccartyi DCMB5]AGG07907.1 NADH ubiquinone oxidoreductase chain A [Dehalococcoides mccartyi BTF08]AII60978.1 NADH-quinone oxidoreductase subunit A [Dehalococcoides mccartyi CG5]AMU86602.1 NADH ubiquinone oxidoreductase chain A [Dehalococcoides mccartyi]AOV99426.1 NADH ubiquinone oxidoreductase chain A [Dehalococcoides mccartyi]